MKYWYITYMVIEKPSFNVSNITYGNCQISCNSAYLPIPSLIAEMKQKYYPNGNITILNFQEIPKESYDELIEEMSKS